MSTRYIAGTQVVVQGAFSGPVGAIDPTDARVDIVDPSGNLVTYSGAQITRVSTGLFTYIVDTTGSVGRWQYRWWSPPPLGASMSGDFIVDAFPDPPNS
jgi:hypothetical protein